MRTKSVSFPDPAKLRSLFGPCYANALDTDDVLDVFVVLDIDDVLDVVVVVVVVPQ